MDLSSIISDNATRSADGAGASTPAAGGLGQQDFLRMLIAQLENQDPLDPQDATEFTAQLAQFSSLDQLISMRQAIDSLASADGRSDGLAAASLIGRNALVESSELEIGPDGAELPTLGLDLPASGEVLSVQVVDTNGAVVATAEGLGTLAQGVHELDWSAFDQTPPPGAYALRATMAPGDPAPELLVRSRVTGAALAGSDTTLLLGNAEIPLAAVREIGD